MRPAPKATVCRHAPLCIHQQEYRTEHAIELQAHEPALRDGVGNISFGPVDSTDRRNTLSF
jgi:hypothetical protein